MLAFSLSTSSSAHSLSFLNNNLIAWKTKSRIPQSFYSNSRLSRPIFALPNQLQQQKKEKLPPSAFLGFNPLRAWVSAKGSVSAKGVVNGNVNVTMKKKRHHGLGAVCFAAPLTTTNLQWVAAFSTAILLLARGTAIHKSFLVPLFALQAPNSIISWMRGEYGIWTAFLALLVRLFFFMPGELELLFVALLLVILAPYQVMNLRGKQEGVIISLIIAAYLAFQHYSRAGSLRRAFDQSSIIASIAIICIVAMPCLLLI